MLPILGIIAVAAVITAIDVPVLWRNQYIKEMWFFFVLLSIGIVLCVLRVLHVSLPTPLEWLTYIYKPIDDVVRGVLK